MEASKFTEVGYVGRDVESMVRDLVDSAINMVRGEREDDIYPQAEARAGGAAGNKGAEATDAALRTADLIRQALEE